MQEVHILDQHGLSVKAEVSWSLFRLEKSLNFCYILAYGTFESHTIEQKGGLSDSGACKNNLAFQWFCSESSPRIYFSPIFKE